MKKTPKKTPKKSSMRLKAVRMGVPTVKQRLDMLDRAIVMIGAGLGVEADDISSIKPDVRPVSLGAAEVRMLCRLLSVCHENSYFIGHNMGAEVLSRLAPTDDQLKAFEPVELAAAGGAR